jgi:hypothetical protein
MGSGVFRSVSPLMAAFITNFGQDLIEEQLPPGQLPLHFLMRAKDRYDSKTRANCVCVVSAHFIAVFENPSEKKDISRFLPQLSFTFLRVHYSGIARMTSFFFTSTVHRRRKKRSSRLPVNQFTNSRQWFSGM